MVPVRARYFLQMREAWLTGLIRFWGWEYDYLNQVVDIKKGGFTFEPSEWNGFKVKKLESPLFKRRWRCLVQDPFIREKVRILALT
jgi:hypothetical protein